MSATFNLEVDIIPVSYVDRAKQFYESVGWRLDADDAPLPGLRIVQFTPPGSGPRSRSARGLRRPRLARPRQGWSRPTSKRRMTNSPAVASTLVTCGTARRSQSRHGSPAATPNARATDRSAPLAILTATRGWCRKSHRAAPASDTATRLISAKSAARKFTQAGGV
jgi:hypothetical protein